MGFAWLRLDFTAYHLDLEVLQREDYDTLRDGTMSSKHFSESFRGFPLRAFGNITLAGKDCGRSSEDILLCPRGVGYARSSSRWQIPVEDRHRAPPS